MRHLMSPLDFSTEELDKLFTLAEDIEKNPARYAHACEGKKLASCFYEPSTRTRLSFESAMLNLGGQVLTWKTTHGNTLNQKGIFCQQYANPLANPCQHTGKLLPTAWQRLASLLARSCRQAGRKWQQHSPKQRPTLSAS